MALAARPTLLARVQACAAIGQSRLMSIYDDAFANLDLKIAQVLLTEDDFRDEVRYANLRATLDALLELGVIPIINENDTVSTMELERPGAERIFGDNDKLSALVMAHVGADLLILLSGRRRALQRDARTGGRGAAFVDRAGDGRDSRICAWVAMDAGAAAWQARLKRPAWAMEAGGCAVIAKWADAGDYRTNLRWRADRDAVCACAEKRMSVTVRAIAEAAKTASLALAAVDAERRGEALEAIAQMLEVNAENILAANAHDLAIGEELVARGELASAALSRLRLSAAKLAEMIASVRATAALPEVIGTVLDRMELDAGAGAGEDLGAAGACWR